MEKQSEVFTNSHASTSVPPSADKTPSIVDASTAQGAPSSPVLVIPVAAAGNSQSQLASESSTLPVMSSSMTTNADEVQTIEIPVADVPKSAEVTATAVNTITAPMYCILYLFHKKQSRTYLRCTYLLNCFRNKFSDQDKPSSADEAPAQDKEVVVTIKIISLETYSTCFTSNLMWFMPFRKLKRRWS
jgi:pre-mRNA-processing factor 40